MPRPIDARKRFFAAPAWAHTTQGRMKVYSYVTVGAADFARSLAFYDAVLTVLGHRRFSCEPETGWASWGLDDPGPHFCICRPFDGRPPSSGNGVMVSFLAQTREQVDRFHAEGLAAGGSDEGAPGLREHYSPTFYAAYLRDPDGNKLNAVCYAAARADGRD